MVYKWIDQIQFVSGYKRGVLYDLPRREHHLVPKNLDLLIKKIDGSCNNDVILSNTENDWLNFLVKNEFIFKIPAINYENFSKIDFAWNSPAIITSCVIEISKNIKQALSLVDELICKHIVLVCKDNIEIDEIFKINLRDYNFQSIIIYADFFSEVKNQKKIINNIKKNDYVDYVFFSSDKKAKDIDALSLESNLNENIKFIVNIETFSESLSFNNYYNRKLFIGKSGKISCTYDGSSFLNLTEIKSSNHLIEIVSNHEFQKYWKVNKDIQDVCKDCEFRYMCIDKRIPYQRSIKEWYHKKECDYNPYISKWKNEDDYKSLDECGVISNEYEFSIDHDKINAINKNIWKSK